MAWGPGERDKSILYTNPINLTTKLIEANINVSARKDVFFKKTTSMTFSIFKEYSS